MHNNCVESYKMGRADASHFETHAARWAYTMNRIIIYLLFFSTTLSYAFDKIETSVSASNAQVIIANHTEVTSALAQNKGIFAKFNLPPRMQDSLLYAPLCLNMEITSTQEFHTAVSFVNGQGDFLSLKDFSSRTNGCDVVPFKWLSGTCHSKTGYGGNFVTRAGMYTKAYTEHLYLSQKQTPKSLFGTWIESPGSWRQKSGIPPDELILKRNGTYGYAEHGMTAGGSVRTYRFSGKFRATSSRLILEVKPLFPVWLYEIKRTEAGIKISKIGSNSGRGRWITLKKVATEE